MSSGLPLKADMTQYGQHVSNLHKKRRRLAGCADAQSSDFVAPPRTIADVIGILEQEKPDRERIAKMQTAAEAQPWPPISKTVATIKAIA